MRRSKEIIALLTLLVGAMGFVLWYVIDRRAQNRAAPPPATTRSLAPEPPPAPPAKPEVDLVPNKTVDFSSGQPVVTDSAADRAAIDEAMKDIAAASKEVTFEPATKPKAAPPPKKP